MANPRLIYLLIPIFVFTVSEADAKNMQGKLGLGYQQALSGVRGLALSYWAGEKLAVDALVGAEFLVDRDDKSSTNVDWGLGLRYRLLSRRQANLSIGLKVTGVYASKLTTVTQVTDAGGGSTQTSKTSNNLLQFAIEAPLDVEFFFSDSFSINIGAGLLLMIVPEEGSLINGTGLGVTTEPGSMGIGIGAGGVFGMAGFTFYL